MMGLDFFRRSVELAERHRMQHQRLIYTIQTNATLINDEWAVFFKENGFLWKHCHGAEAPLPI
jgi:serine-type anaerobic sulfatase-maturating enzyme